MSISTDSRVSSRGKIGVRALEPAQGESRWSFDRRGGTTAALSESRDYRDCELLTIDAIDTNPTRLCNRHHLPTARYRRCKVDVTWNLPSSGSCSGLQVQDVLIRTPEKIFCAEETKRQDRNTRMSEGELISGAADPNRPLGNDELGDNATAHDVPADHLVLNSDIVWIRKKAKSRSPFRKRAAIGTRFRHGPAPDFRVARDIQNHDIVSFDQRRASA